MVLSCYVNSTMNDAGAGLWLILVVDGDGTYLETTDSALQARFVGAFSSARFVVPRDR